MSELRSIVLAIELATRQRDDLAKVVARTRRTLGGAQHQMAQLQGYAGETDARWSSPNYVALSAELIRHHYQFTARLQQAIVLQTDAISKANRQVELTAQALLQAEFRLAGLKQVLETRQAAQQLTQRRREQRLTDEFAGMQHARTRVRTMSGETI